MVGAILILRGIVQLTPLDHPLTDLWLAYPDPDYMMPGILMLLPIIGIVMVIAARLYLWRIAQNL